MSKWFMRCIAALLLLTFQPGLPVPVQIQPNENNAPHAARSVFNLELISAAEAAANEKEEESSFFSRFKEIIVAILIILFICALPALLPLIAVGAIIYYGARYVVTGKSAGEK